MPPSTATLGYAALTPEHSAPPDHGEPWRYTHLPVLSCAPFLFTLCGEPEPVLVALDDVALPLCPQCADMFRAIGTAAHTIDRYAPPHPDPSLADAPDGAAPSHPNAPCDLTPLDELTPAGREVDYLNPPGAFSPGPGMTHLLAATTSDAEVAEVIAAGEYIADPAAEADAPGAYCDEHGFGCDNPTC